MTVWLTGAAGMLGSEVARAFEAGDIAFLATDVELDITDVGAVSGFFGAHTDIRWVVNCAAYTNVDGAEDDEDAARSLNAYGPQVLAEACRDHGASLLHISTDYVFDGKKTTAYLPDDPVDPTGVYGRTKAEGERLVRETLDSQLVLRTAWLYGRYGKNFVETMTRLMNERDELRVVDDQHGSPTNAADLAVAIAAVVTSRQPAYGTFHYTGSGETTWYGFAREIYRLGREYDLIGTGCTVLPTTTAEFGARAPRPAHSLLDCSSFAATYGVSPVPWEQALERYLSEKVERDE